MVPETAVRSDGKGRRCAQYCRLVARVKSGKSSRLAASRAVAGKAVIPQYVVRQHVRRFATDVGKLPEHIGVLPAPCTSERGHSGPSTQSRSGTASRKQEE